MRHVAQPTSQAGSRKVIRRSMFSLCSAESNKARTAFLGILGIMSAGCQRAPVDVAEKASVSYARENPIGRYVMARGDTDLSVVVLDTRSGKLRNCVNVSGRFKCLDEWTDAEFRAQLKPIR